MSTRCTGISLYQTCLHAYNLGISQKCLCIPISIGHVNIGMIFYYIRNFQWCIYNTIDNTPLGCSTLSQECYRLIGWYCKMIRRKLWTLTCPIVLVWNCWSNKYIIHIHVLYYLLIVSNCNLLKTSQK